MVKKIANYILIFLSGTVTGVILGFMAFISKKKKNEPTKKKSEKNKKNNKKK